MATRETRKIEIENFVSPGHTYKVDAGKYEAMRRAYLKALPGRAPGLTQAEIRARLGAHLPEDLFPGGAKAGWWAKAVQLDLEAKGLVARSKTSPLRFHKV
jgi:hypothetical protein